MDVKYPDSRELMIETKAITDMAVKLVNDEELEFDPENNPRRGRLGAAWESCG